MLAIRYVYVSVFVLRTSMSVCHVNMNNSKKVWQGINEIIYNKFSKVNEAIFLDDNGNIITDQKTVANRFNKFYTTIADKLVTKLETTE